MRIFFLVASEFTNTRKVNCFQNEFEELFTAGIVNHCFTCKNIRYVTTQGVLFVIFGHLCSASSKHNLN